MWNIRLSCKATNQVQILKTNVPHDTYHELMDHRQYMDSENNNMANNRWHNILLYRNLYRNLYRHHLAYRFFFHLRCRQHLQ